MRKGRGKEAGLSYQGNVRRENRNRLIVGAELVIGEGAAETEGALRLVESVPKNTASPWAPTSCRTRGQSRRALGRWTRRRMRFKA